MARITYLFQVLFPWFSFCVKTELCELNAYKIQWVLLIQLSGVPWAFVAGRGAPQDYLHLSPHPESGAAKGSSASPSKSGI